MFLCVHGSFGLRKKPLGLPFSIFRLVYGLGQKARICDIPPEMDGLKKIQFLDDKFRQWFSDVVEIGFVSIM